MAPGTDPNSPSNVIVTRQGYDALVQERNDLRELLARALCVDDERVERLKNEMLSRGLALSSRGRAVDAPQFIRNTLRDALIATLNPGPPDAA